MVHLVLLLNAQDDNLRIVTWLHPTSLTNRKIGEEKVESLILPVNHSTEDNPYY